MPPTTTTTPTVEPMIAVRLVLLLALDAALQLPLVVLACQLLLPVLPRGHRFASR